jgi:hypothetical protein
VPASAKGRKLVALQLDSRFKRWQRFVTTTIRSIKELGVTLKLLDDALSKLHLRHCQFVGILEGREAVLEGRLIYDQFGKPRNGGIREVTIPASLREMLDLLTQPFEHFAVSLFPSR